MALSILITGGTGFLGSAIVDAVRHKHPDWAASVMDLKGPAQPRSNIKYMAGDVTAASDVTEILKTVKPTVIVHTAGLVLELADRYGRKSRDSVFDVNVNGIRNVIAGARENEVEALVWTGSCTAVTDDTRYQYPNMDERWPISHHSLIYGESKASSDIPKGEIRPCLIVVSGCCRSSSSSCI